MPDFPDCSARSQGSAGPRSLATTSGVSIDFLSSGYLDVSVPRVRSKPPMYSGVKYLVYPADEHRSDNNRISGGFPHSEIPGSKLILSSPGLIAEYHVLHRLLLPRHPPNALLALDLIQKKQGFSEPKACILPATGVTLSRDDPQIVFWLVILDLDSAALRRTAGPG